MSSCPFQLSALQSLLHSLEPKPDFPLWLQPPWGLGLDPSCPCSPSPRVAGRRILASESFPRIPYLSRAVPTPSRPGSLPPSSGSLHCVHLRRALPLPLPQFTLLGHLPLHCLQFYIHKVVQLHIITDYVLVYYIIHNNHVIKYIYTHICIKYFSHPPKYAVSTLCPSFLIQRLSQSYAGNSFKTSHQY